MLPLLYACLLIILFFIGASLGSFASAIAYRQPKGQSWVFGDKKKNDRKIFARSFCPCCHHSLSPLDLIPIVSWLFLKGRCRYCRTPVSKRYPLVELAGGIAMAAVGFLSDMNSGAIILVGLCLPVVLSLLLIKIP